jgi:hypothetical protein
LADGFRLPRALSAEPLGGMAGCGEDDPIESARLSRDGWTLVRPGKLEATQDRERLRWRFVLDRLWQKPQPGGACALRMLVRGIGKRAGRRRSVSPAGRDRGARRRVRRRSPGASPTSATLSSSGIVAPVDMTHW